MSSRNPGRAQHWESVRTFQYSRSTELPRWTTTRASIWMRYAVVANIVLSTSAFNEGIVPPGLASLQQYASICLWTTIAVLAMCTRPQLAWRPGTDTLSLIAFYGFAVLSVLWTDLSVPSLMKASALAITSFGSYYLATRLSLNDIIAAIIKGLSILTLASVLVVFLFPSIGVDESWPHEGNWQGVFGSKQSLGVIGAVLMFFSAFMWLVRERQLKYAASFVLAAACVLGSASRGGGALAVMACVCVYAAGRSRGIAKALGFAPALMTVFAGILIGWLYGTGDDALYLFGTTIDLTGRTLIWQHALAHFGERPILGFGINGFWTTQDLYLEFLRAHGWVLDNFHSGYIAVMVEAGVVGYALFVLSTFLFGIRMFTSIGNGSMPRSRIVGLIGFVTLIYMIDFMETIFLRSTSFLSTLILIFFFIASLPPASDPRGGTR
jgi:exopolysaccharide production protein ExoQ